MIEILLVVTILILAAPLIVYALVMGSITKCLARIKRRMAINSDSLKLIKIRYGKFLIVTRQSLRQKSECGLTCEPENKHMHQLRELDQIADDYLAMSDSARKALRYILSNDLDVLEWYRDSACAMLEATKNRIWLLRGLAAISLENCQCDFRDSTMALDRLLDTAKSVGIDWRADVLSVAQISDGVESLGGGGGTQWRSTKDYFERRAREYD
jgi:hypothetical protein